ncbi:MAG: hypothetical protein FWD56_07360, partial [Bacteroidales bacterium]|nr:hypothetical protein [Bacteroidales bacterium]
EYASSMSVYVRSFSNMANTDYTTIRHLPPLSIGVKAHTRIGDADVECGIIYTYLSSRFSWTESGKDYDVRQSLHYVGVPLNLVGYLWNTHRDWKVYFTVGAMVEKGLRGIYQQDMLSSKRITSTTIKSSSIEGLQWSFNGAIGVSHRLKRDLSIYFEPRIGYFFDCKQPISMRTEWPLAVGFGVGVNYQFKNK